MDLKTRIKRLATFNPQGTSAAGDQVDEPDLGHEIPPLSLYIPSAKDYEYKDLIHEKLLRILDLSLLTNMESEEAHKSIRDAISRIMGETSMALNAGARAQLVKLIEDEVLGLGPIEPLLAEPSVADILVNGAHAIYVERFGRLELTPLRFKDDDHLMKIIDRIVSGIGRRIDESSPMVDARLKDGSRVNAIIPPLALDGPMLSIRRFMTDRLQLDELVATDSMNAVIAEILKATVKGRLNILISGGTGSGKTTLLNAMSNHIPEEERVVTIEDSAELQLQQAHVIRLETRPANIEGKGEVTQRELVRNSLRMRPDRIVLGEVRGEEAFDMLQAMNTGHDGSLTTIHSNAPRDAIARLENMISMTGFDLPVKAMRSQIASAIDMIIQLERMEDGRRRLVSVHEIEGMEADVVTMAEIFRYEREGLDEKGQVLGHYTATGVVPTFTERLGKRGIKVNTDYFNPDYTGDPHRSDYTLVES